MSENTTEPTSEDQPVQPTRDPEGGKRFAVFNTTLEQYVGPVTDKRPTKAKAEALVPKGHDFEVREV